MPLILTEAGLIALAKAIEAIFAYQKLRLEKVPEAAQLETELLKPWLHMAEYVNKSLGI